MVLHAWNPLREMDALRREIDRAFHNHAATAPARPAFLPGRAARQYPLVNIAETPEAYVIEALAPGVDPESLNIAVLRDRVEISGEKQPSAKDLRPDAIHRNERAAGRFTRVVELGVEVDDERVTAEYKDGILLVTLPKAVKAQPRRVVIKAS